MALLADYYQAIECAIIIQHNTKGISKNIIWRKILFCVLSIPFLSAGAYLTVSILDEYFKMQAERNLNKCFEGRDSLVANMIMIRTMIID